MSAAAPPLQKERIGLLLRRGFIIAAGHFFFHRCNGKTDLSPRSHFLSDDNDSCWKTFVAIGKINVLFCQSRLDGYYLSCPSICPLYDALFFASVISSVSNPSISPSKLSEWKFMDYGGICFVDLFGLSR